MRTWARRLTAPWSPRIAILNYHRVCLRRTDPHRLCASPARFEGHLERLKQTLPILRLGDLVASLHRGTLPKRAVVVTFDDGYADNLREAKPILERQGVPATVFVSTGHLGSLRGFWWDELEKLLPRSDYVQAHAALRSMPPAEREAALARIRARSPDASLPCPEDLPLNPEEACALAQGDLIEIGAHAHTHSVLSALPEAVQRDEILLSKRELEELIGRPVRTFAYPYGGVRDFGSITTRLVRESGFTCACATVPAPVSRGTDPFALPRFTVRDWEAAEFAARLDRFLRS